MRCLVRACILKSRIIWERNKHICIFTYLLIFGHAILRDSAINISNLESLIDDCVTLGNPCDRRIKIIIPVLPFTRHQYVKTWDLIFLICFSLFIPNTYITTETLQTESGGKPFWGFVFEFWLNDFVLSALAPCLSRNGFVSINRVVCLATHLLCYYKLIYKFNIPNEKWVFVWFKLNEYLYIYIAVWNSQQSIAHNDCIKCSTSLSTRFNR